MSTDLSAPHYVIFSIHPLPRPSQAQIFFSAPRSQIPAAYVPPLGVLLQFIKLYNIITLLMLCISVEKMVTVFWGMKNAGRLTVVYLLDLEET